MRGSRTKKSQFAKKENEKAPLSYDDTNFFEILARCGSLSKAANSLQLSVGSVSKRLSGLEQRLGAKLIRRNARHFRLTQAGEFLLESASNVNKELALTYSRIRQVSENPEGCLRIGTPEGIFDAVLTQSLISFLRENPKIQMEVFSVGHASDFLSDYVDCQLIRIETEDVPKNYRAMVLCPSQKVLVASEKFLKKNGRPQSPEDLKNYDCLAQLNKRGRIMDFWQFRKGTRRASVRVHPRMAGLGWQIAKMAEADMGIARLPEHLLSEESIKVPLVRVLPDWLDTQRHKVCALYLKDAQLPARINIFLDFLKRYYNTT